MITMLKTTHPADGVNLACLFTQLATASNRGPRCELRLPLAALACASRRETRDQRRRRMIRDTERYLSDPLSTPWARR